MSATNKPAPQLLCYAGHRLQGSVTMAVDVDADGLLRAEQLEADVDVFCSEIDTCSADIDPDVRRRVIALLKSVPYANAEIEIQTCSQCGCTELAPCENGCSWVSVDRCSTCADESGVSPVDRPCSICQHPKGHESLCPAAGGEGVA